MFNFSLGFALTPTVTSPSYYVQISVIYVQRYIVGTI